MDSYKSIESTLLSIGVTCYKQGKFEDALKYLNEALDLYRENTPQDKSKIGYVLYNIGLVYEEQGKPAESLAYYDEFIQLVKNLPNGSNQVAIADSILEIGLKHYYLNRYEIALERYFEALDIYKENLKKENRRCEKACSSFVLCLLFHVERYMPLTF